MKSVKISCTGFRFSEAVKIAEMFGNKCADHGIMLTGPSFTVERPKKYDDEECVFDFVEYKNQCPFHFSDALQYSYLNEFTKQVELRAKAAEKASSIISNVFKVVSLAGFPKSEINDVEPESIWKEVRLKSLKEAILLKIKNNKPIPKEWVKEMNNLLSESNGK